MPNRSQRREKVRSRERLSRLNRAELVQLIYDIRKDNIALEERCARLERQLSDAEARMLSDETNTRLDNIEGALREIGVRLFPELIDDEAEAAEILAAEAAEVQAAPAAPAVPEIQAEAPAEPEAWDEPEIPAEPEAPAEPEVPAAPAEPVFPEKSEPEEPKKPEVPAEPAPAGDMDALSLPNRRQRRKASEAPAEPEAPAPVEDKDVLSLPIRPRFHKAPEASAKPDASADEGRDVLSLPIGAHSRKTTEDASAEPKISLDKLDEGPYL